MKTIIEILNRSKLNLIAECSNINNSIKDLSEQIDNLKTEYHIAINKVHEIDEAIELLSKGNKNESTSKNKKTK